MLKKLWSPGLYHGKNHHITHCSAFLVSGHMKAPAWCYFFSSIHMAQQKSIKFCDHVYGSMDWIIFRTVAIRRMGSVSIAQNEWLYIHWCLKQILAYKEGPQVRHKATVNLKINLNVKKFVKPGHLSRGKTTISHITVLFL